MKIWQRYLFFRLLKVFLFFLACIVILYIAVDFSLNGMSLLSKVQIAKFFPLFFSLSFLFASLRILLDLAIHSEIAALQIAGLSTKKILSPFFLFALILALFSYATFQWVQPKMDSQKVLSMSLDDGSELIYQEGLKDVFWIISFNEIWHIKELDPPMAKFADHFFRVNSILEKGESFEAIKLDAINFKKEELLQNKILLENRSLTSLFVANGADKKRASSLLHYKLASGLVPFLLGGLLFPFALKTRRGEATFVLIASSLFFFIGLMTLLDAILILGENLVVSPIAIWTPYMLLLFRLKK